MCLREATYEHPARHAYPVRRFRIPDRRELRRGSLERLPDLLGAEATDILLMSDSFARRYVRFAAVRPARSHAKITDHGSSELSIRI